MASPIVLHRQCDRVKRAGLVGLGRIDHLRRGPVAEVPAITQQPAIRIARGAAIEHHDVAGADLLVAACDRDRRAVDGYGDGGGRGSVAEACAVVDRQHDGVAAALGVGVRDHRASVSRRAVAEVPAIGQGIAVGVGGTRAVERDRSVRGDDVRPRGGDRRVVDADLDLVAVDRVDRATVVGHRQLRGIDPRRRVGANDWRLKVGSPWFAEIPPPGRDLAVGIERVAGVEGHRIARRRPPVGSRPGDRRRVDHDFGLVVVDRLVLVAFVAHAETHAVDRPVDRTGSGDSRADSPRRRPGRPTILDHVAVGVERALSPRSSAPVPVRRSGRGGIGDRRGVDQHPQESVAVLREVPESWLR